MFIHTDKGNFIRLELISYMIVNIVIILFPVLQISFQQVFELPKPATNRVCECVWNHRGC
jgi:hypothetical protein